MTPNTVKRIFNAITALVLAGGTAAAKPLKVYLLAGQSNMQGQAQLSTVPRMALSPETKELHDKILDQAGNPIVHKNVSIVYFTGGDVKDGVERPLLEKKGFLSTGFGSQVGPELGFGITMGQNADEPILIIKTAWGGKSLLYNFRPPSAGLLPFEAPKAGKKMQAMTEADLQAMKADYESEQGAYYRLMIKLIHQVLADPGKYCDAYDPKQGYEIAGFGWFQGYNDMLQDVPTIGHYTENMAHFIRDVRRELKSPNMPFVIGVIGIGGKDIDSPQQLALRKSQAATANLPEFKGNVAAIETAGFWDHEVQAAVEKVNKAQALWDDSALWEAVGTPAPNERIWSYTSFQMDDKKLFRNMESGEDGDIRTMTGVTPAELDAWLKSDFDTSKWQKGLAPIRKGEKPVSKKKQTEQPKEQEMAGSPWGEGNVLLMKTSFVLDRSDFSHFRLCLRSTSSYRVYLNGHLIREYQWWKDGEMRAYEFDSNILKQGTNELAFYGDVMERRNVLYNAVDLYIKGLTGKSADEIKKLQDAVATPLDHALAQGKSNQPFHYLGSAYTYSRVGDALAMALIEMQKNAK